MNVSALNRFRPGQIWNDTDGVHINAHGGGILFHEGLYYWFGEHKIGGTIGNSAQVGVGVYSSPDLFEWKNEGIALRISEDPQSEITRGCILERPKVIFNARTGKFVMWFHLEPKGGGYSGARSGVAVADAATGPYKYLGSMRPNAGVWPDNVPADSKKPLSSDELSYVNQLALPGGPMPYYPKNLLYRRDFAGGQMARDMTLFVDDDGSAYHIFSSEDNGTLHVSLLSEDYTKPAGRYVRVQPGRFNEGPSIMKRDGRYFMITSGCTGWTPNEARLLVADSIWGPWDEVGTPCQGSGEQIVNTFESQSTFILPVQGIPGAYIFMADRWCPRNAIDGRYVWLPIQYQHDYPVLRWQDEWGLEAFSA